MQENRFLYRVRMVTIRASCTHDITIFRWPQFEVRVNAVGERSDVVPSVLLLCNGSGARF
jgi:hypothetical protein